MSPSGGNERPLSNTTVTQLFYSFGETRLRRKFGVQSVWRPTILSRRFASRIEDPEHVWVLWQCDGRDVVSRVQNLSTRGLFIETPTARSVGAVSKLGLLVSEGQIRAEAVVRHAQPDRGLGLKFNVNEDDRPRLAALLSRLRSFSRSYG